VSGSEPEYVRRRRENERERNEAARRKLDRRLVRIEVVTALGIWATVVATAIAIVDVRRSNNRQIEGLVTQQKLMQGQLDTMIAQQRPWISATPRLDLPLIRDVTPNRSPDLSVPVTVDLKNHGASPATNIVIYSMIIPASASHDSERLIQAQEALCTEAEQASNDAKRIGISVFPGEEKHGSGIAGIEYPRDTPLPLFIMQGCIEYTYNGILHGKTGYRMYLGHINVDTHLWEGFAWRTDSQRTAPDAGVILEMKPRGIDFRETDDGGNWAR
jgi:hypothetical protein